MTDSPMLSAERLDKIEGRVKAATSGPWRMQGGTNIFKIIIGDGEFCDFIHHDANNAVFIAHARADIPALLSHTRALEAENGRLREALRSTASALGETVNCLSFAFEEGAIPKHMVLGLYIDPYGMLADAKTRLAEANTALKEPK